MLKSEQNTVEVKKEIEDLAKEKFKGYTIDVFFEHGHWWVKIWNNEREAVYDVVDAETTIGEFLDFELLEEQKL